MTDLETCVIGKILLFRRRPPSYLSHGLFLVVVSHMDKIKDPFLIVDHVDVEATIFFVINKQKIAPMYDIMKTDKEGEFDVDNRQLHSDAVKLSLFCDEVYLVAQTVPLKLIKVTK